MAAPTQPSADAFAALGLNLLENTLARTRGRPPGGGCWPAGEDTLLGVAHTFTQHASPDTARGPAGDATNPWRHACEAYVSTLSNIADIWTWPTVKALSLTSKETLEALLYPSAVASLRARNDYRLVDIADIPAPENPYQCQHWKDFTSQVSNRNLAAVMKDACGWPGRIAALTGKGAGPRQIGSVDLRADRNARNTSTQEAFVEWLNVTNQPPCSWHDRHGDGTNDWPTAADLARACWDDQGSSTWTNNGVDQWMAANAPAELRLAARTLLVDPIVWAGPGWSLGNGQTRYLALVGSGARQILVAS